MYSLRWWFGDSVAHFKRVHVSCISNSFSSQVNLYIPIVTAVNANVANGALTIGRVCAALEKYAWPCWSMYNRLHRNFTKLFRNSIIW